MEVCRPHCFISMPMISSPLKSRPFGGRASRTKQLPYHFQVIKPKMPESKSRKDVLIPIIGPIHSTSVCLHAQHLHFRFLITPPLIVSNSFHWASHLSMSICMTLRSLKTDWLPASKLSPNIEGANAYASVFSSSLQLIRSIIGMGAELESDSPGNAAKNAWNRYDQTHCWRIWVPWLPYTFAASTWGSIMSLLALHIHCLRPVAGILYPALIHNGIVTDLNLTVSPILLLVTFSLYLKLSHVPTSLLLEACSLMNAPLDVVILLSFCKRTLYKTDKPRWLRRVIALTQALAKYRYIIIRSGI